MRLSKPPRAFGLSVLVALGLHAAILFVPRIAERRDTGPPVIELTLEIERAAGAGPAAERAGAMGPSAAARAARPFAAPSTEPARARVPAPAPVAARDTSETSSLPASTEPAPGSSGANDQAQASTAATGGVGTTGGGGTGVAGSSGPGGDTSASGDAQPLAAASATQEPRLQEEMLPAYPRSAKKAGWQGVVTIRAVIDETGSAVSAVVLTSSGYESLDRAAVEWVRRARFEPAVRQGRPVSSPLIIPVRFQLN